MKERAKRVAENESVFRKVNEHHVAGRRSAPETFEILCECADTGCSAHIRVTNESYARARAEATDFLLEPEHVKSEFEIVIESYDGFVLVRKTGEAAVVAKKLDPNS